MTSWFALTLALLGGAPPAEDFEFFEKKIRPVLVRECYGCHSTRAQDVKGALRLDSRAGIRAGGLTSPAIVPGKVSESLLIAAIRRQGPEMPPDKTLPPEVIADFVRWVESGAPDPRDEAPPSLTLEARRDWWSLRPVARPTVPAVEHPERSSDAIDRFLLRKLDNDGLEPAPPADRRTLLRRLSFVLRGLPPGEEEVQAFLDDRSIDAYERTVDRFLASPAFGERWARHWLDVISFSETQGHEWNPEVRGAWRYRDYVIRAFNDDIPYNQLVVEHLAGDLLDKPRWDPVEDTNESLAATAFLRFGEIDHDDCRLFPANFLDPIEHQIDTISKAFQATTLACARCHDHKFDAVSMRDYYALSGILSNARHVVHTLDRPGLHEQRKRDLETIKRDIHGELGRLWKAESADLERYASAALARAVGAPQAEELASGLEEERLRAWSEQVRPTPPKEGKKGGQKKKAPDSKAPPPIDAISAPLQWLADNLAPSEESDPPPQSLDQLWTKATSHYEEESKARRAFNEEEFTTFVDFRERQREWRHSGHALGGSPSASGDFVVAADGDMAIASVLQAGLHSHTISDRLNASLRSPLIPKAKTFVSVEAAGLGGAVRRIYENCSAWNGGSVRLKSKEFRWVRVNTQPEKPEVSLVLGLTTRFDDYGYPGIFAKKFSDPENIRSHFSVRRVVFHDCEESPKPELNHMEPLLSASSPESLADVARLYADALTTAVVAWIEGTATDTDAQWLDWAIDGKLLTNRTDATPRLQDLIRKYRAIEGSIRPPKVIAGVTDFDQGFDVPLRIGGEAHRLGETVPRGDLGLLVMGHGDKLRPQFSSADGSGRLELARAIADPKNPLSARVMVNRIWHHVFGAGLARTPDDFGRLGERPTHPELLDYLAGRFVHSGWSIKRMLRDFVTTRAFRMQISIQPAQREKDPENESLHHYPLRRLEGEAIRDAMLAVSGRLEQALYGPSIDPYRTEERPVRKLLSGPVDGHGRRSVYTRFTLTEEPPFLATFNLPDPKHPRGRRDVTNVPAQALTLMNNPFVVGQAELWADRLVDQSNTNSVEARLEHMFRVALTRPPAAVELEHFRDGVGQLADLRGLSKDEILTDKLLWKDVAHLVFNLKEFIYLR